MVSIFEMMDDILGCQIGWQDFQDSQRVLDIKKEDVEKVLESKMFSEMIDVMLDSSEEESIKIEIINFWKSMIQIMNKQQCQRLVEKTPYLITCLAINLQINPSFQEESLFVSSHISLTLNVVNELSKKQSQYINDELTKDELMMKNIIRLTEMEESISKLANQTLVNLIGKNKVETLNKRVQEVDDD